MTEIVASSVDTLKLVRPEPTIARVNTGVAAFVGRALKGPLNQPTLLHSFEDYQRIFGGLWQPSTLSYAIEQFFENGGHECTVVRVANGARAPTVPLAAGTETLLLAGRDPGTREFLRAAVDYDGIAAHDTDRFNLTVQRVRAPGSEFVEDQEIFRRVSILEGAERSVSEVLAQSRLVRVSGALPRRRPDRSGGAGSVVGYVGSRADGDDGDALTSYDIIGDIASGSGLFALRGAAPFNFLCIPPLSRELDVAVPALLVALRICRERQAMLIVDPPAAWTDAAVALERLRSWPLYSEDVLMFYPRVLALDRKLGRPEIFGSAAAAAGLLARSDQRCPVWSAAECDQGVLRPSLRGAVSVNEVERARLAQHGINVLRSARAEPRAQLSLRTLIPEGAARGEWRYLAARRLALFVTASILRGTRWALFMQSGAPLWARLRAQVTAFFEALEQEGAFVGRRAEENYFVVCDERLNAGAGALQLVVGFAVSRPGQFQSCLITHAVAGSSVRTVSVNQFALPLRS